jgi:hypothetical protein
MNDKNYMPLGFRNTSLNVLNPRRSVIIDMIMVQFISVIVVMLMILIFKGQELSSSVLSYYLVGLFGSVLMLTGVYARITRGG